MFGGAEDAPAPASPRAVPAPASHKDRRGRGLVPAFVLSGIERVRAGMAARAWHAHTPAMQLAEAAASDERDVERCATDEQPDDQGASVGNDRAGVDRRKSKFVVGIDGRPLRKSIFRKDITGEASLGVGGTRGWAWVRSILVSGMLGLCGIGALSLVHYAISDESDYTLILGSFGASAVGTPFMRAAAAAPASPAPPPPHPRPPPPPRAHTSDLAPPQVLLYAAPFSPFSQPRNLVGGHLVAALIGVACYKAFAVPLGSNWLASPLSVAFCIVGQMATDTVHPPGGGTALIAGALPTAWAHARCHDPRHEGLHTYRSS